MTQLEFVDKYHDFLEKGVFGGDKPDDSTLVELYNKVVSKFGDVPDNFFSGVYNMAMGYLSNLDYVLGREPKTKHIHEWLYEAGLWK